MLALQDTTIAVLDATGGAASEPFETAMVAADKLPVVLGVVLIVWAGLLLLLAVTERRLRRIEARLDAAESAPPTASRSTPPSTPPVPRH